MISCFDEIGIDFLGQMVNINNRVRESSDKRSKIESKKDYDESKEDE